MPTFKLIILAVDYGETAAIALPRNNVKKNETKRGNKMITWSFNSGALSSKPD